ncbi:MAG: hypothetical protein Q8R55_06485 [Candidatus Taylorbacteria bacterium]|nr:hypothetical protein [Candidatus Taylorbacteria bacterium]
MDGRDGLQLLPGTKKRLGIKVPGENRFLYIGSAVLGSIIVVVFWLNLEAQSFKDQIKMFDEQILSLDQNRNKQSESNISVLNRQLTLTSQLINEHIYFSKAISKLESLMQDKIQIESLSIKSNGEFSFTGFATNYTIVARQIAVFLVEDSILDIQLGEMNPQADGLLKFNIQIDFDKTKFIQNKK